MRLRVLLVALAAAILGLPGTAAADPITYESGNGASVTFESVTFEAGARVNITGAGFVGTGGSGYPLVAIKLDDGDDPVLNYGGADSYPPQEGETIPFFEANPDGTFSGWVDLPADISLSGPETAAGHVGDHWLRILSGAFSSGDNYTSPITFKAYFRVQPPIEVGATTNGGYFPGNVIPATAVSLSVRGLDFDPSEEVGVELDGNPLAADLDTDAGGDFTGSVSIPAGQTPGEHELSFSTSTVTHDAPLEVVPHTATLRTPAVRPGGTVIVDLAGFRSVSGAGQKVALNLAGTGVIACVQTDEDGAARATVALPDGAASGTLTALAGTKCAPPTVAEPFPRVAPNSLTVSDTAPQVTSTFVRGSAGGTLPVAGSGFPSGAAITVQLDGTTVGSGFNAAGDGSFAGSVTIPAGTAPGARTLTFTTAGAGAALGFEAVPAPTAKITTTGPLHPGSTLSFALIGFGRGDGTAGQKVAVKIDSGEVVACLDGLDATGKGSGTVTLPADVKLGAHTLRLLAGTSCVSGGPQNDLPARTLGVPFTVTAAPDDPGGGGGGGGGGGTPVPPAATPNPPPPAGGGPTVTPAPPKARSVKRKGKKLRLAFSTALPAGARVTVRTARKVRLGGESRVVTLARVGSAKAAKTVTLSLTRDGRRLLRKLRRVTVVVTVARLGGGTSRRTLTLRAR